MKTRSTKRILALVLTLALLSVWVVGLGGVGADSAKEDVTPGDLIFETMTVRASRDTTLHSWYPSTNFGGDPVLSLRSQNVASPIIWFDLTGIEFIANKVIGSAVLKIFVQSGTNPLALYATAYPLNRAWVEGEATWLNADATTLWTMPGASGVPEDQTGAGTKPVAISGGGEWVTFDVTKMVRQWFLGTQPNYGVVLKGDARGSVGYELFGANQIDARWRPYLEIEYATVPTPTPTVTATPTPIRPALEIVKTGPVGPLKASEQTVTYNITVQNIGTDDAAGVVVTDVLPLGTVYVSCTEGGVYDPEEHRIVWPTFNLDMGESKTIVVHVDLARWVAELGTIVNVARATCPLCPGLVEDYWETIIIPASPTPTPTVTPSPTPWMMYLVQVYEQI